MAFVSASIDEIGKMRVAASGNWIAVNANQIEQHLYDVLREAKKASSIEISLTELGEFDTYGAWLLERLNRELSEQASDTTLTGLEKRNLPLLEEVAETLDGASTVDNKTPTRKSLAARLANTLGRASESFSWFVVMFGALMASLGRALRNPRQFRLTAMIYQMDRVGWQALPIVIMVTFIIGAIIAQQGFFHFRRFGADLYVVDMIGFLIMREIGVLLVAIVIAGRTGSSFTAELGSMKMREEVDALKTMGFNPVDVLILPRVLVLVILLPALTFVGSLAALLGAGVVATTYAGMTTELFMDRLNDAISMDHFLVGLIKAPFIGLVIGVIACAEGLQVRGSTTSLGQHTTQSVVKSIFMVIVLDGLFALFFSSINM